MFYDFSWKKISTIIFIITVLSGSVFFTTFVTNKLGDDFLRDNLVETRMTLNAFEHKFSFAYAANNKNLTASVASIFNNSLTVENNNNIAKSVPVLLYHGIINEPDGANVLLENFKDQMFTLKKAGWQTVSTEDFYQFMKGEKNLPDKSFLLTFDDGRKDSYYPVDPILKALDYRAVIYVITGRSLNEDSVSQTHPFFLNKAELQKIHASGRWDIQAHTRNGHDYAPIVISPTGERGHFYSNLMWLSDQSRLENVDEFRARITDDFLGARNDIEQALGVRSISFAYPFGDFGQNSVNFPEAETVVPSAVNSIYPLSFHQVWPGRGFTFDSPREDISLAKRIKVIPDWSGDDLLATLERGRDKDLPYRDNFDKNNGWIKSWGRMIFGNGAISIGSHSGTTGSLAFLDGSNSWGNYVFQSRVDLVKGQTFTLLARYKNDSNYVACVFTPESIRIEQMANGERSVARELKGDFSFTGINREVGIGVYDDMVNCYLDGKIAMQGYDLDERLDHGGIGFKTWDQQIDNSELIVKNVSVEEIK